MRRTLIINPGSIHRYLGESVGLRDMLFAAFVRKYYDRRFQWPRHTRCITVPPVTLMNLQQLFEAQGWEARAVDEQVQEIGFSCSVDLVCLTAVTAQYERAAWIARQFRQRGIPTAIGGVHASCMPEACKDDFDTVCVGEAEAYLDRMLADLSAGRLQPLYRAERRVDMNEVPFLRHDLAVGRFLPFHSVALSRGCDNGCDFCSIRMALGGHRTRSVDSVVRHISEVGARHVWFHDANLTADKAKAKALFRALIPLKITWMSSVPVSACLDEEMLDLMAASGCWLLSLGFETLSQANLQASRKRQTKVPEYLQVIQQLHSRRIAIEGNFIFGFDSDTLDVFDQTAKFVIKSGIDIPNFFVLTPYPIPPLYRGLDAQGRIVDRNWSHYENVHFALRRPSCHGCNTLPIVQRPREEMASLDRVYRGCPPYHRQDGVHHRCCRRLTGHHT